MPCYVNYLTVINAVLTVCIIPHNHGSGGRFGVTLCCGSAISA